MKDNRLGGDSASWQRALAWQSRLFISRHVFSPSSLPIRRSDRPCSPSWSACAELAAKTGQPIRADPQRARPIIATGSFRDLFEALKKGVATASFSPPVVCVCNKWTVRDVETDRAPFVRGPLNRDRDRGFTM